MRLFEVDQGGAREVMAVLQGLANKPGQQQASNLPWPVVKGILDKAALGISTPDGFRALTISNSDPKIAQTFKSLITNIDDNGDVTLNTNVQDPNAKPEIKQGATGGGGGPSVSSMASHNAKNAFK